MNKVTQIRQLFIRKSWGSLSGNDYGSPRCSIVSPKRFEREPNGEPQGKLMIPHKNFSDMSSEASRGSYSEALIAQWWALRLASRGFALRRFIDNPGTILRIGTGSAPVALQQRIGTAFWRTSKRSNKLMDPFKNSYWRQFATLGCAMGRCSKRLQKRNWEPKFNGSTSQMPQPQRRKTGLTCSDLQVLEHIKPYFKFKGAGPK